MSKVENEKNDSRFGSRHPRFRPLEKAASTIGERRSKFIRLAIIARIFAVHKKGDYNDRNNYTFQEVERIEQGS